MRPLGVVVDPPSLDHASGTIQPIEKALIEALVATRVIKAFDRFILDRFGSRKLRLIRVSTLTKWSFVNSNQLVSPIPKIKVHPKNNIRYKALNNS